MTYTRPVAPSELQQNIDEAIELLKQMDEARGDSRSMQVIREEVKKEQDDDKR